MTPKPTSLLILVCLLVLSLPVSGCIGLTNPSKLASTSATGFPGGSPSGPPTDEPTNHYVKLTWTPSASEVTSYNVYRAKSSVGPFSKVATLVAAADQYIDEKVEVGETYYYVITSVTAEGMESTSSASAVATIP